jgi:hypothetical protein
MNQEDKIKQALDRLLSDLGRLNREEALSLARVSRRFFIFEAIVFVLNAGSAAYCILDANPQGLLNVVAAVVCWHAARDNLADYRRLKHLLNEPPRSKP